MSPVSFPPVPAETSRAAHTLFGSSNFYLLLGDQVNDLFSGLALGTPLLVLDIPFARLNKSGWELAALYIITIFQFLETLPDNQVEDVLEGA